MIEWSVLNDIRPLARGAHFLLSGAVFCLVYYGMSRGGLLTLPTNAQRLLRLSRLLLAASAALWAHWCLDVVFRVP